VIKIYYYKDKMKYSCCVWITWKITILFKERASCDYRANKLEQSTHNSRALIG